MRPDDRATACPECAEVTPRVTHTTVVHRCNHALRVAEWSECARCHRRLSFRVWDGTAGEEVTD